MNRNITFKINDVNVTISTSPIGFLIHDDTRKLLNSYLKMNTSRYAYISFDKFISYKLFELSMIITLRRSKLSKIE